MSDQESLQKPPQSENEEVQETSKVQNAPNSLVQSSPQHQKLDFMSPYDIDISQYNPTSNSKTSSSFSPYDLELTLQSRNQIDPQANKLPSSNQVLQQFPQADGDFKQNSSQLFPYMGNNSDVLVSMTKDQRIKKERNIIMKYYRKFCDPIEAGEYKNARNKVMFAFLGIAFVAPINGYFVVKQIQSRFKDQVSANRMMYGIALQSIFTFALYKWSNSYEEINEKLIMKYLQNLNESSILNFESYLNAKTLNPLQQYMNQPTMDVPVQFDQIQANPLSLKQMSESGLLPQPHFINEDIQSQSQPQNGQQYNQYIAQNHNDQLAQKQMQERLQQQYLQQHQQMMLQQQLYNQQQQQLYLQQQQQLQQMQQYPPQQQYQPGYNQQYQQVPLQQYQQPQHLLNQQGYHPQQAHFQQPHQQYYNPIQQYPPVYAHPQQQQYYQHPQVTHSMMHQNHMPMSQQLHFVPQTINQQAPINQNGRVVQNNAGQQSNQSNSVDGEKTQDSMKSQ